MSNNSRFNTFLVISTHNNVCKNGHKNIIKTLLTIRSAEFVLCLQMSCQAKFPSKELEEREGGKGKRWRRLEGEAVE